MICPACGSENIDGVVDCATCSQPLSDLTLSEPATAVERSLLVDRVAVLSPKTAVHTPPHTPVRDVLAMLVDRGIGCVVVADAGKPVGVFSERDALVKLGANAGERGARPVSEFMTPDPETLEVGAKLAFALQRMDVGGYRHLPIVDDAGTLTGVISVRDILRYLADKLAN
jgi:CBS domain-containing protein